MKYTLIFILIIFSLSCKIENKTDNSDLKTDSELKTTTMNKTAPSEKLTALVFKGLDHAVSSIKDGNGPLIPFVMEQTNGQIKLRRFMEETLEEGLEEAKKYLTALEDKPDLAVIVYDGRITIDGSKYDAFLVNGYEKIDSNGYCFAQQYKPKKMFSPFKEIGNASIVSLLENILGN